MIKYFKYADLASAFVGSIVLAFWDVSFAGRVGIVFGAGLFLVHAGYKRFKSESS